MYLVMVIGLTVVLPVVSVIVEFAVAGGSADVLAIAGKWFLFWGVGVRLFVAGISQTFRPEFTVKNILGNADAKGAGQVVKELGFANLGMGLVGLIAPWVPGWTVPGAIAPALFLGLAGIVHILKPRKNGKEWVATVTDLIVAVVLAVFVIVSVVSGI
jgi:hypothetical protein